MTATPTRDRSAPSSTEREPALVVHAADLELARRVLDGDAAAWNAFVERYAGLILAMIRRYLRSRDPDDARTVFVSVLASVRSTRLNAYAGRASLATWLALVARSEVTDHLRRQFGRGRTRKALDRLSPEERTLFQLYCVEGWNPGDVLAHLAAAGRTWTYGDFVAAFHRIERKLGERWLKHLSYDLHAQSIGATSGRLLEYLDHVHDEFEQRDGPCRPEYYLMEREARRTVEQLRSAVAALDPADRRLLELRFERGWTARRIADELGMGGQRGVYGRIQRLVAMLRRRLVNQEGSGS